MFIHQNTTLTNAHHDYFTSRYFGEGWVVPDGDTAVPIPLSLRDKALLKSGSLFIAIGRGLQKHGRPSPRHPRFAK